MECGVSPLEVDAMSLCELATLMRAMKAREKGGEKTYMSDDEFNAMMTGLQKHSWVKA